MRTIVMATQKGGAGKSTLSIGLALAAQEAGHIVRLIETDKQGTLSNWQCRRGLAEPIVEAVYDARAIERRLEALQIQAVVDVARVGRAPPLADHACGPQLAEVVRDEVGWLAHRLHKLVHLTVARRQSRDQPPAHVVAKQLQEYCRLHL